MVFETLELRAPEMSRAGMAAFDSVGEGEVQAPYVGRENGGTGAGFEVEKLWSRMSKI